jgi:hypothetical protein
MGEVVARTRRNRAERPGGPRSTCFTKAGTLTCPRCGWPAHSLTIPYHDSVWAVHGGFCCECAIEAVEHYDENGWPPFDLKE